MGYLKYLLIASSLTPHQVPWLSALQSPQLYSSFSDSPVSSSQDLAHAVFCVRCAFLSVATELAISPIPVPSAVPELSRSWPSASGWVLSLLAFRAPCAFSAWLFSEVVLVRVLQRTDPPETEHTHTHTHTHTQAHRHTTLTLSLYIRTHTRICIYVHTHTTRCVLC